MGSYAECWLGSFYVGSTKNDIDPSIMQLFRSSDKKVMPQTKKDIPLQLRSWSESVEDDDVINVVYYGAPVHIIRDRLDLKGYVLNTCKAAFTDWVNSEILQLEEWSNTRHGDVFSEKINFLKLMNVDAWLSSLETIHSLNLKRRQYRQKPDEYTGTLIGYMLDDNHGWYGFPGLDLNVALRLALEVLPSTEELIYDVTDLILSDYYSEGDDLVTMALEWSSSGYVSAGKTIVITEGSIDTWIISESLQLLYPHLLDYYTFMDFEGARVGGGAGSLANIVKTFSGTGIVNKVIALFDNDTAATSALRGLRLVKIPANIKIVQLPKIDFLANYPTLGPSGQVDMDVNGLAGSIELYLGKDVLLDSKGNLLPVQWTGYISEVGKYQGEVMYKEEIQKTFKQKVTTCKTNKTLMAETDWSGLQAVLQSLFSAFLDFDEAEIRSLVHLDD